MPNELINAAARGWLPPRIRAGKLSSHLRRAARDMKALACRLDTLATRAEIDEELYPSREKAAVAVGKNGNKRRKKR